MTTKVEHINNAYSQIRISGLTVNPAPEDLAIALTRLEDFMAELYGRTVDLNYRFEENPDSNTESGVDKIHNHMIATNLAVRLLPDFGKEAPPTLIMQASSSYSATSGIIARERMKEVAYPARMPRGSGNRRSNRWRRFYPPTSVPITDASNVIMYRGDITDVTEDFIAYLAGDTIASYTVTVSSGLTLTADSINDNDNVITTRIQANVSDNTQSSAESVVIVATTTDGRVETRTRQFEVKNRELS